MSNQFTMEPNISIAPTTPLYGVINLLNYIQKNNLADLDWQIAENPNSGFIYADSDDLSYSLIGNDENVYRFYYLPESGIEFSEYDFDSVEFDDLKKYDQERFLEILDEIDSEDSQYRLAQLKYELEESEEA
jgi:hypothetical protein